MRIAIEKWAIRFYMGNRIFWQRKIPAMLLVGIFNVNFRDLNVQVVK